MKVFISGPVCGPEGETQDRFDGAALRLEGAGIESISYLEVCGDTGPCEDTIETILDLDGVALLDGWEDSPSAVVEALTASSQGAPALPIETMIERFSTVLVALVAVAFAVSLQVYPGGEAQRVVATVVEDLLSSAD